MEELVQEHSSSPVQPLILVLHKDEGRGERGVQCGGADDVQERQTVLTGLVSIIQD